MADAYWNYGGGARYQAPGAAAPAPIKRPRTDYAEVPGGPELVSYDPRDEKRVIYHGGRENEALGASYGRNVRNGQVSSYGLGESARNGPVDMPRHPIDDGRLTGVGGTGRRTIEYGGHGRENPISPDASNTLFVEGLPANCTRREVSHIFRPFPGFQEVRLVSKESKYAGADVWILCFADFASPSQAAVALDHLQGYKFDEQDRDSPVLKLQFSRFPGPRSSAWPRGRR